MTVADYFIDLGILVAILAPILFVLMKAFYWFTDRHERAFNRAMMQKAKNEMKISEFFSK